LSTSNRGTKAAQQPISKKNYKTSIIVSYNVYWRLLNQKMLHRLTISNIFSRSLSSIFFCYVWERMYVQSICLCVSNNYECIYNPKFYIIKKKMCKFKICSILSYFFNSCYIDAGTLSRVVNTYEIVVMYVRDYTDWIVVFLFTMFLKY